MRTTLNLDDDLLREAKQAAAGRSQTLTALVQDALRAELTRQPSLRRARVELPTGGVGRLRPGVNLDSWADLLDLIEGDAPS